MACPASGNLPLAIPGWTPPDVDPTAGAKGKGTDIHAIFDAVAQYSAKDFECIAESLTYVAEVRKLRRFKVLSEHTFTADWLQSKPTTQVDLCFYVRDELHIIDYKTGRIPVSAFKNAQLMFYAACAGKLAPAAKNVWLHVVQPWADNIDYCVVSTATLAKFMAEAQAAEAKLLAGDTTFGPSDNCTFCPANPHSRGDKGRPLCPAMMQKLYPQAYDEDAILNS